MQRTTMALTIAMALVLAMPTLAQAGDEQDARGGVTIVQSNDGATAPAEETPAEAPTERAADTGEAADEHSHDDNGHDHDDAEHHDHDHENGSVEE